MRIKTTAGRIICEKCERADTPLSRMRGLMFSEKRNILFVFPREDAWPIHSLFVFFPFYAIYLDNEMRVVEKFRVEPFALLVGNTKPARYLLEITGENKDTIKIGEKLCLDGEC